MKEYKILSWNVNGIRAIAKKGFLDWFKKEDPDILCLQETKAWEEQLDESLTNVDGYHSYFSQAYKKGYSGTVIYTKENPLNVKHGIGVEEFDREGRFVIAEYPNLFCSTYISPTEKLERND